jgi:ABC-type phosphate transport system substrate-binding protein
MRPVTLTVTMRRAIAIALGLLVGLLVGLPVAAGAQEGFVLIANRANPISTLARLEASQLFLGKRSRWSNGLSAQPVDQVESSPVRRHFSNVIHGMDVPSVKGFWQEMVFSGRGDPPPERTSDADVIAYVKANPSALGYVGGVTPADGVKIITVTR